MRSGDEDAAGFEVGVVGEAACALRSDSPNAYEALALISAYVLLRRNA